MSVEGWMHIYPQYTYHSEAFIRGDRAALMKLRDAIDKALAGDQNAHAEVFAKDGEGYAVQVQLCNVIGLLGPPPYSQEYEAEARAAFFQKPIDELRAEVAECCHHDFCLLASTVHASDCSVNNAPALPVGPCDCGAVQAR